MRKKLVYHRMDLIDCSIKNSIFIEASPTTGRLFSALCRIVHNYLEYCEGYTEARIRTDEEYIRNEVNRQHSCIYIVWLYEPEPRTLVNSIQLILHNTPVLNLILMNPTIL